MDKKKEEQTTNVERLNKEREGKTGYFKSGAGFDGKEYAESMKTEDRLRSERMRENDKKYEEAAKNKATKVQKEPKKGLVAKAKEGIKKVKDAFIEAKKEVEKDIAPKVGKENALEKQQQKSQQQQAQHKPSALQQKAQEQLRVRKTQESKSEIAKTEVTQKQVVQKSVLQQKSQQVKSASPPKRVTVKAPPTKGRGK